MSNTRNKGLSDEQVVAKWEETNGNVRSIAKQLGISRGTVYHYVNKLGLRDEKPLAGGHLKPVEIKSRPLPKRGVKRYLFTCLQSNTEIHDAVWANLLALRDYWKAELHVSRFTYNKNAYGKKSIKPGEEVEEKQVLWFDPRVAEFTSDEDLDIAPGLRWCGRMNTLPTATSPLTGFETYTGSASGIFPHTTIALRCVPTGKHEPTKFLYSTGTVGTMNYVQKRAGIKAEHHHAYGALLVEVDKDGDWWARQLHAGKRGEIYDLDVIAEEGETVEATGETVHAINWGDIHNEKRDPELFHSTWGPDGILDELMPKYQFFHDTFDPPKSHHSTRNPHEMFEQFCHGTGGMQAMVKNVVELLSTESYRDWCTSVVVNSNHDNMIQRWLRESDYKDDPENALFFLRAQLGVYEAIAANDVDFYLPEWVAKQEGIRPEIRFLREDEEFVELDIEFGQHGHLGSNGARGSAAGYAKAGRKVNRGHDHTPSWLWGALTAGVWGDLDQGYNSGMSSWSHTMIVTYANGRRALVTVWKGKHKA